MKRFVLAALLVALAILALSQVVSAQSAPEFKLGFKALADQVPEVVGQPLENEHWGDNGDSLQQTTTGLMVWRKADNWTAFTNGSRSWINGPFGVMERGNDERFEWEEDALASPPPPLPPARPSTAVKIAFVGSSDRQLYVMNSDGTGVTAITRQQQGIRSLSWSPDGKRMVFTVEQGSELQAGIYSIDLSSGQRTQLTRASTRAEDWAPAWSPSGDEIAFKSHRDGDDAVYLMNSDGGNVREVASPTAPAMLNGRQVQGHQIWPGTPGWSPDGRRMAVFSWLSGWGVYTMNRDGSNMRLIAPGVPNGDEHGVAWSPRGDRLAYAITNENDNSASICTVGADGSSPARLTTTRREPGFVQPAGDSSPSWSPDGNKLAFTRVLGGRYYIYAMNADGTEQVRLGEGMQPVWQPSGS